MTPSTCKNVLGVFVSVGIADNPTAVVDVTTRVHLTRTVEVTVKVRRVPPVGIVDSIIMDVTIRANVVRIVVADVVDTVRRARLNFSWCKIYPVGMCINPYISICISSIFNIIRYIIVSIIRREK